MIFSKQKRNFSFYLLLVILNGSCVIVFAQGEKKLYPLLKGDKYGLVDCKKNLVVGYNYDYFSPFSHGIAIMGNNRKYGLVNYLGKVIVPVSYDSLEYSYEGLYIARLKDSLNIIDTLGNQLLHEWYYDIRGCWNQFFQLIKLTRNGEEYLKNTIRHYSLENIIGLDRDSVLSGNLLYGYYSKQHPALNGIWFSGGSCFTSRYADVAISTHTYFVDSLGKITPRKPYHCDLTLMSVFVPDEPPCFPGGKKAFNQFMRENLKYPSGTEIMYHNARVEVCLVIDETGQVEPFIFKSLSPDFDSAVFDAVMKMPKWTPARYKGKPVCSRYIYKPLFIVDGLKY